MPVAPTTSPRRLIRQALIARLKAAGTRAGLRVFSNRSEPFQHALDGGELPAIAVYTLKETSEIFDAAPRSYLRTLRVSIECVLDQQDNLQGDDQADDFAQEVEEAVLDREGTLESNVEHFKLVETAVAVREEGERLLLSAVITLEIAYITYVDEAQGVLSPFVTAHLQHRFPGDTADRITTDVPIPQ